MITGELRYTVVEDEPYLADDDPLYEDLELLEEERKDDPPDLPPEGIANDGSKGKNVKTKAAMDAVIVFGLKTFFRAF